MTELKEVPKKQFKGMLIAVPCYGGEIKVETHACISHFRYLLGRVGASTMEYTLAMNGIEDTRNCILSFWYDHLIEYDHLLMVDNDMQIAPETLMKMIQLDKPLVGAIYSKREMPQQGNVRSIIIGEREKEDYPIVDGFQRWKYVGGGVLLIKREMITKMLEQIPQINDCIDPGNLARVGITRMIRAFDRIKLPDGVLLSEDYSFCERWQQCGGEVWAAVGYPIGHVGLFNYCINAADLLGLEKKDENKEQSKDAA